MRIFIAGPLYPIRGGNALVLGHICNELAKKYLVKAVSYKRLYPSILFPGKRQEDISQMEIKPFPADFILDSVNPLSWLKAGNIMREFNPHKFFFNWWNPFFALVNFYLSKVAKSIGAEVIAGIDNLISHEERAFDQNLTKIGLAKVDRFIAYSKEMEDKIKAFRNDAVVHTIAIPPPEDFKNNSYTSDEAKKMLGIEGRIILFFGYVRKYKGLEFLIKAMPEVLKKLEASLLIVGEFYENKRKYLDLIEKLGIMEKVKIIDRYVNNEEVSLYFSAADLVVLPYVSATQSAIVPLAFSFEKPVIVTEVGGLPEEVDYGRAGIIVPPKDPSSLANAIIDFFSSDLERFNAAIKEKKERDKDKFASIVDIFSL